MHPSGARVQPTQDPPTYSIANPLETIKRMFEGAQEELARERSQKDDMEAQREYPYPNIDVLGL